MQRGERDKMNFGARTNETGSAHLRMHIKWHEDDDSKNVEYSAWLTRADSF